jgi:uncharacterized protein YecE (DUF72 family)
MEFGRVTPQDLDKTDFTLPPDHPDTTTLLSRQKEGPFEVYVGCSRWSRPDWVGKVYPPKTRPRDFLKYYAQQFNSIELNATFYQMPTYRQTSSWRSKAGDGFRFCPKFLGTITHAHRLSNVRELTDRFLEGVMGFGKNLGPLFLMPHPSMGPETLETLEAYLASLPEDIEVMVELRHRHWYAQPQAFDAVFHMLQRTGRGSVITDAAGRRDCVHMRLTTPTAFIRFVGNGLHPSDFERCDAWLHRLKAWKDAGLKKIFFFIHQHDEQHAPELCRYFILQANHYLETRLQVPRWVDEHRTIKMP